MENNSLSDLKKRLIVSTISVIVIIFLIFFSMHPIVSWILGLAVASLATIGTWEYAQFMIKKGLKPALYLMCLFSALFVILSFISLRKSWSLSVDFILIYVAAVSFFIAHFKNVTNALNEIAGEFFSLFYIALPLSLILFLLFSSHIFHGKWWAFYLIAVTKSVDIGAYFIGRLYGKHKLAPSISPQKTIEGAIGGFILSILISALFAAFKLLPFTTALWLGALLALFAQLGDLAESLQKRDAGVKDSNSLPGLGGVLDMIDSLLFTTPILCIYLYHL